MAMTLGPQSYGEAKMRKLFYGVPAMQPAVDSENAFMNLYEPKMNFHGPEVKASASRV